MEIKGTFFTNTALRGISLDPSEGSPSLVLCNGEIEIERERDRETEKEREKKRSRDGA